MKIDWAFLRLATACFAGAALLSAYPLSEFATMSVTRSVVAGGTMSYVNLVLGYLAIEVSFDRSHTTFLKYVLGGMVGRLLLMWGTLLILVRFFDFHAASLMLTLLFFYALNLALEIAYLQKRVQSRQ